MEDKRQLASKFSRLKTSIGGNREKFEFEDTFGMPGEEQFHITRPNKANTRIIGELEFALHMVQQTDCGCEDLLSEVLDYLLDKVSTEGVLTNESCEQAENMLEPMEKEAKSYKLILASHAHIDMNWMWSYNETVAVTLATFRSILNVMEEYPEFCYSQSQGEVYRIVEEFDPDMMEEIKERIKEGRWEVTAAAWVETDKNMPSGESLLRHIQYTREYLSEKWGVKDFEVDFSPDTFGHSACVPEIDSFGEVKYYYHCRGNARKEVLYRFMAPSGKEVLAYREPNWYNGAITPHIGSGFIEISKRCKGLRTGLVVYGVGDHGGGPTRRDVERAVEMMSWRIYPEIKFGTIHQFFREAESIREMLPVVDSELNYFANGCYTTQSRIKRANRYLESTLLDAEAMTVLAGEVSDFRYAENQMKKAWREVLFTHFHDILTGSCVQDSREYAMGLYQHAAACANTQLQNSMRSISQKIDTSSIYVDIDGFNSQSEGAGAGYGIENFSGVPSTERGSGRTRIFHVFNTRTWERTKTVELTVWDWTGDLRCLYMTDRDGNEIEYQLLDRRYKRYWDHQYIRVLVKVTVPALGYTTVVLRQRDPQTYPVYLQDHEQVTRPFDDYILDNGIIRVSIDRESGRISSLFDIAENEEMIANDESAGLTYIETETATSSAWNIGRYIRREAVARCLELRREETGELRSSVKAVYDIYGSKAEVVYSLEKGSAAVRTDCRIDWKGTGSDIIPVLDFRVPTAYSVESYQYDIPAGVIIRPELHNDVPGLKYGLAVNSKKDSDGVILISDSKYGYRGADNSLALTLINSSTSPDPYPERGIHNISLWIGICKANGTDAQNMADDCTHSMFYQPSNSHKGTLPLEFGLLQVSGHNSVVSSIVPQSDGSFDVRVYETMGITGKVKLTFASDVKSAVSVNLLGRSRGELEVTGQAINLPVEPFSLAEVRVVLK